MSNPPLKFEQRESKRPKWQKVAWAIFVICFAAAILTKGLGLW